LAMKYHTQYLAMMKEVGDRAGEALAYGKLGKCHLSLSENMQALKHYQAYYDTAEALKLGHPGSLMPELDSLELGAWRLEGGDAMDTAMAHAALGMGVALARTKTSGSLQAPGASTSQLSQPAREWLETSRVNVAEKRLQTALDWGDKRSLLHLAYLAFNSKEHEEEALGHLKKYLSWIVERGRTLCNGCGQRRGEDAPMLTCSGCRVVRFCNKEHQKMASQSVASGGNIFRERHKDICGVLGQWRQVASGSASPDSCTPELLAFLKREKERENERARKIFLQREGERESERAREGSQTGESPPTLAFP
jgi:hypothetical protein